jgi:hypothetical protein
MERRLNPRPTERIADLDRQIAESKDPTGLLSRIRNVAVAQQQTLKIVGRRAEDKG